MAVQELVSRRANEVRSNAEPLPVAVDPVIVDHKELGVATKVNSEPWCVDHVLLQNVMKPLTVKEIAARSGVDEKRALKHLEYWMGKNQVIGKNNWTLKRTVMGLHLRLREDHGKYFLLNK